MKAKTTADPNIMLEVLRMQFMKNGKIEPLTDQDEDLALKSETRLSFAAPEAITIAEKMLTPTLDALQRRNPEIFFTAAHFYYPTLLSDARDLVLCDYAWHELGFRVISPAHLPLAERTGGIMDLNNFLIQFTDYGSLIEADEKMWQVEDEMQRYEGKTWKTAYSDIDSQLFYPILSVVREELLRLQKCGENMLKFLIQPKDLILIRCKDDSTSAVLFDFSSENVKLPSKLLDCRFKLGSKQSKNTLELLFDGGWALTLGLRTAYSTVKPSSVRYRLTLRALPAGVVSI